MLGNAGIFVNFRPLKTQMTDVKSKDTYIMSTTPRPLLHAEDTMSAQRQPILHAEIHYESTMQAHTSTLETKQVGSTLLFQNHVTAPQLPTNQ